MLYMHKRSRWVGFWAHVAEVILVLTVLSVAACLFVGAVKLVRLIAG